MIEFNEGDLVLVKNEVVRPANQNMIDYFGGRVFAIERKYHNAAGEIRYELMRTPMSQDCPPIVHYIWAPENLIPYGYNNIDFEGVDDLI